MAFPSIDAVRNLRSNRVRTARLTPPPGYGDAWRRLVQRNAAQRVQQCVSQRTMVPSPDIAGGPRGAHCTATAAATAAVAKVVLACSVALCCALLRSAAASQRPAVVANGCRGGVSPRHRGSASARSSPRAQGSRLPRAVDAADLQGERALRPAQVRHWDRTAQVRRAPSAARSVRKSERGADAGHGTRAGTANLRLEARSSQLPSFTARGEVSGGNGRRCCFCCAIDGLVCCETAQHRRQQPPRSRPSVRCCPSPCQSSKHGRRGFKVGSFACICLRAASSTNAFVQSDSSERAVSVRT